MGQVYVIRKEITPAVSVGGGGGMGMQMLYTPGMENRGPQLVQGVNPQGLAGLQTNPMTQQFEAKPQMDDSGKNEIGVYEGDKYGAMALNQMNRRKLREGETRALDAGQTAFDRGAKYGQFGADFGRGLAGGLGLLAGAVSLANAGASGQDAVTGGLGAAQMGSMTYQQGKKPLSEAVGGTAARMAGRSVGVIKPEVADPTPQVAEPTPTHTEDEMINMRGKVPVMTTDSHGLPVEFGSRDPAQRARAQRGSAKRVNENIGRDTSVNTNYSPVDHMGMPTAVGVEETGMVTGGGAQSTFPTGSQQGDEIAQAAANKVKVAPATTNTTQQDPKVTGTTIANELNTQGKLPGVDNTANEIKNATQTPEGSDPDNEAAKEMSGKKPSSTDQSMVGKMVGVIGSKRIVGVI